MRSEQRAAIHIPGNGLDFTIGCLSDVNSGVSGSDLVGGLPLGSRGVILSLLFLVEANKTLFGPSPIDYAYLTKKVTLYMGRILHDTLAESIKITHNN